MSLRPKIKVCGITNVEDYLDVVRLGADYVGFIFYTGSPRNVDVEQVMKISRRALLGRHLKVGVFVNETMEKVREIYRLAELDIVQLHGDESPRYVAQLGLPCWKAIRVQDKSSLAAMSRYKCDAFLLDTYKKDIYGGTGETFPIDIAVEALKCGRPIILSGGISAANIGNLSRTAGTFHAIDINSTVEETPGKKNKQKLETFFTHLDKSFCGVQGRFFQKEPLAAGGNQK